MALRNGDHCRVVGRLGARGDMVGDVSSQQWGPGSDRLRLFPQATVAGCAGRADTADDRRSHADGDHGFEED